MLKTLKVWCYKRAQMAYPDRTEEYHRGFAELGFKIIVLWCLYVPQGILQQIFFISPDDLGFKIFWIFFAGGFIVVSVVGVPAYILSAIIDTILNYTIKKTYKEEIFWILAFFILEWTLWIDKMWDMQSPF